MKPTTRTCAVGALTAVLAVLAPPAKAYVWQQGPSDSYSYGVPMYDPKLHTMLSATHWYGSRYLSLTDGSGWHAYPPDSPAEMGGGRVFDPQLRRFILIHALLSGGVEVWQQPLGGGTYTKMAVAGGGSIEGDVAVFDPVRRRVFYFGLGQDWVMNLEGTPQWTPFNAQGGAPTVFPGRIVYDPLEDRLLVWDESLMSLFSLNLGGPGPWSWVSQAISGSGPIVRDCMTQDLLRNRLIFFGGSYRQCDSFGCWNVYPSETWAASLDNVPFWVQLPTTGARPAGREGASLLHDPINDRFVLHAGNSEEDTWYLPLSGALSPHVVANPLAVNIGGVSGLGPFTATIDLSNVGPRNGCIHAIVSSSPKLTVDTWALPLHVSETRTLHVTWSPTQEFETLNATIEIMSSDRNTPNLVIPVTGQQGPVGVGDDPAQSFSLRLAGANPVRGVARFALTLPESRHAEVGVYDLRGSLVKRLVTGELPAGSSEVSWDGSDASGRPMGAGVYFVRAVDGEHDVSARVVIAR